MFNYKIMKKFNINKTMYIQIYTYGWEHLNVYYGKKYVDKYIKYNKKIIDGVEWYPIPCWKLFSTCPVTMGDNLLFGTDVLFKDSDLENVDIDK